ncbi:PhnD/SsuA/transferrin family substrate-binding protein, partial [Mesorhizobium sp.]|uniref:PhnD/SsuA/transferrin family substrate-binding protein n=1 Tax=Mesorhizobium sp. TaxID=1871066 RepID=UPI0011F67B77
FFTYGHRNVIRAVASGLAQSGSVDGYVYEVMRETEPDLVKQTRIVRKSEWLGFPPIASPKSVANDRRVKALRQALISMKDDAEG